MYTSYFKGNDLIIYNVCYVINYCLFGFFVPLENFSNSFIWKRHHCRWSAANFDLCSALMAWSSEGSLACHTYCDTGHPLTMVISEDPWHSRLLASVWRSIIDLNVSLHSITNIFGCHMNNFMHFGWVIMWNTQNDGYMKLYKL